MNIGKKDNLQKYLGKIVTIVVDRPLGSRHPKHPDMVYPVNYGYIEGVFAPDMEEQDVYILGVDKPLDTFTGRIIGVISRENDVEDKWVAAPDGVWFTGEEILQAVEFQEKYFFSSVYVVGAPLAAPALQ